MGAENCFNNLIGQEAKKGIIHPFAFANEEAKIITGYPNKIEISMATTFGTLIAVAFAKLFNPGKAYLNTATGQRQKIELGEPSLEITTLEVNRTYGAIREVVDQLPKGGREVAFGVSVFQTFDIIKKHADLNAPLALQKIIHETLIHADVPSEKDSEPTPLKTTLLTLVGDVLKGQSEKNPNSNKPDRVVRIAENAIIDNHIPKSDISEGALIQLMTAANEYLDLFQFHQTPEGQLVNLTTRPDVFYFSIKPGYMPRNEEEKQMLESGIDLVNKIFMSTKPWSHFNPESLKSQEYLVLREIIKHLGSVVQLNVYDIKTSWTHEVENIRDHAKQYITDVTSTAVAMLANLHHFYPEIGLEEFIIKAFENEGVVPYVIAANNPLMKSIEIMDGNEHQPNEIKVGVFRLSELTNNSLADIAKERLSRFFYSVAFKQRRRMIAYVLNSKSMAFDTSDPLNEGLVEFLNVESRKLDRLSLPELAQEVVKQGLSRPKNNKGNKVKRKDPIYLNSGDNDIVNDGFTDICYEPPSDDPDPGCEVPWYVDLRESKEFRYVNIEEDANASW